MVSALVVGQNTLGTKAEADAYLGDSSRAAGWSSISAAKKAQHLITAARVLDRQCWQGVKASNTCLASASVNAGGTGYTVGDVLAVVGGTAGAAAKVLVATVSSGAVTGVTLSDLGLYTVEPSSPVATSGGSGTGCTLNLVFQAQVLWVPRTGLTDQYGNTLSSTVVPSVFKYAQFELAFELSQDTTLETSGGQGSNTKRLQAGSASIEYFRPTGGVNGTGSQRFSIPVMELIGRYLCGAEGGVSSAFASGTDGTTTFDPTPLYDLSGGYP